jgi:hypothetical protein
MCWSLTFPPQKIETIKLIVVFAYAKMARAPFPKQSNRKTDVLELIHTDVCGPMRTESLGGAKYYAEFIDDATTHEVVRG